MPRFVILEHDHPVLHWDLMLEAGEVLQTWRLGAPPQPGLSVAAEASFHPRLTYLDYEGPTSGPPRTGARWDAGSFNWLGGAAAENDDQLVLRLEGHRLQGTAVLWRDPSGHWSLRLES